MRGLVAAIATLALSTTAAQAHQVQGREATTSNEIVRPSHEHTGGIRPTADRTVQAPFDIVHAKISTEGNVAVTEQRLGRKRHMNASNPSALTAIFPIQWFNSAPVNVADLAGHVVVLGTFQMLCPGCVTNGLPQLQRIHDHFDKKQVRVIGLHTVFEHHAAMTPVSLAAFIHEYRLTFPIAVDGHDDKNGPSLSMKRLGLRGTPSLLLVDHIGKIRLHQFGHTSDLIVGAAIQRLVDELPGSNASMSGDSQGSGVCTVGGECNGWIS